MTGRLTAISGRGPKEPAAFLLEAAGKRVLLDLGQGPMPEIRPDPTRIGRVDALVLSHAHKDHCGALDLLERIGSPPVYATRSVLDRVKAPEKRELPARGFAEVVGISVQTGRSGHALGGIWTRFEIGGGLLYMGDHSAESRLFAFDQPPPSRILILDGSYGGDQETRDVQAKDLIDSASLGPIHLPVPADGRGIEIAIALWEAGIAVAVDDVVRAMLVRVSLSGPDHVYSRPGAANAAAWLAKSAPAAQPVSSGAIVTADGTGDSGASARLIAAWHGSASPPILFTGHLQEGTRGRRLVDGGLARFRRWNVHPTLAENAALVGAVGPERVMPAFADEASRPAWRSAFAPAVVVVEPTVET